MPVGRHISFPLTGKVAGVACRMSMLAVQIYFLWTHLAEKYADGVVVFSLNSPWQRPIASLLSLLAPLLGELSTHWG